MSTPPKLEFLAFPRGACVKCLERWQGPGVPGAGLPLPAGGWLIEGYCAENEAGYYAIAGPSGRVTEWSIRVPVDAAEWQLYVSTLPGSFALAQQMVDRCKPDTTT